MKVEIPEYVEGEPPFNLRFTNHKILPQKWRNTRITVWMVSTKIPIPHVKFGPWKLYPFYWNRPEIPEKWLSGEWKPRYELLFGSVRKHGVIHRMWGTQPINTYVRGHFALFGIGTYAESRGTQFVLIQQYFKGGWWGDGNEIVIREQLQQDEVAIPLLIEAGIIKDDTPVYFMDQSKPETEIPHGKDPFRLFYGKNCLEEYKKWLPTYLREWRANDFGMDIEEVIERYVKPFCQESD